MKAMILVLHAGALILTSIPSPASLVVDAFTQGEFVLSLDGRPGTGSSFTGPIGGYRIVGISERLASDGSVMTATSSAATGSLSLTVDGESAYEGLRLNLALHYAQGGPFSIAEYSAFELELADVMGMGFVIVELGSESDYYGPDTNRVPLTSPGVVTVPYDQLNFGDLGSVDSFYSMHITFEAETTQFAFTLDEIRLVPEPTSLACLLVGAASLLARQRAQRGA